MKELDKKDVVVNDVDGDAVDALSADLADVIASQTDSVEDIQLSLSKKEKELDDSKQADAKESVDVAAADSGLADMIMAESQNTATSGQGGGGASADGGLSSNGKLLAVAGVVTAAGIAVAASDGGGSGGGGKNNQEFTVSIDSPTATEGDSGTKVLNFTVTLDEAPKSAVTFNYSVAGGTATGDIDFDLDAGTITFEEGQTIKTVSVVVRGDTTFEADETVVLTVSGDRVEGGTNSISNTGTITNDDADPATFIYDLSVNAPTVLEGDNGTVVLRYELSLDRIPTEAVQVGFQTLTSGTATADVDFVANSGSVTFAAGQSTAIVDVVVNGDTVLESNETVDVRFTGTKLSGSVTATGTIVENDLDPTVDAKSLTTSPDNVTANVINSAPEFTPGGNTLINTLQDEDVITGVGNNATLNAVLGNANDFQETTVTPKMTGVQTANFEFTGGAPGATNNSPTGIDFENTTGLQNLNVNRILTTNAAIAMSDLEAGTDDVSVSNATRGGVLGFAWREEVLTGDDGSEVLDFALSNVRLAALGLAEGTDAGSDAGFFFEVVNVVSNGNNDLDNMTIQTNGREDLVAGRLADTTKQDLNIQAGDAPGAAGSLEVNRLNILGVDNWNIQANHQVDIARDKAVPLTVGTNDGVNSIDLENLTITGAANVLIDGLEGDIGVFADSKGVTIDAGAMTGNLRMGVSGGNGDDPVGLNTARDDLFSLTSGSGDDEIATYGVLGGDIVTNGGDDSVLITDGNFGVPSNLDSLADLLGTASIDTGAGDDIVGAANLQVMFFQSGVDYFAAGATLLTSDRNASNNGGFDDILTANISTGTGNDTVTVAQLQSGQDWDNFQLNDANIDDLFFIAGSTVNLGSGDNIINLGSMQEGTSVTAEDGNDTVNVELGGATVMAGDTDADLETLGNTASTQPGAGGTKEVDLNGNVDRLGAVIELGGGDDTANFIDAISLTDENQTIVGRDAELRAGAGNDTMNVTALDMTSVNTTTSAADQDALTTGVQTDANANILGVETLNATIANQIDAITAGNVDGVTQNDNDETDGSVTVDIMRFDSALADVNLVSQEARLLQNPTSEIYEQGEATTFNVFNLRQPSVNMSLTANEASGIAGATTASNGIAPTTGELADDRIIDVTLNVDLDNARGDDDTFSLDVLAGSESFDLSLNLGMTTTDLVGDAASATDDDDLLAEHVVINLQDDQSHRLLFNGFGDAGQSNEYIEGSLNVETSVTVNDSKAGSTIVIDQVSADTVTATGAADTEVYVSGANNYEITTGAGDDLVDMFYDVVRADNNVDDAADADGVDNTDEADILQGGGGVNRLRVSGDNNLGSSNAVINGNTDDDVFENIFNFDDLEIGTEIVTGAGRTGNEFFAGATMNDVVLDEAAQDKTNLKNIIFTGGDWSTDAAGNVVAANGEQTTDITIGENFENNLTFTSVEEGNEKQARLNLIVENQDSDSDVDLVNMDFFLSTQFGTSLVFQNTGDPDADVNITVNVSDIAGDNTFIEDTSATLNVFGNGFLDLQVQMGDLDSLTLLDNKSNADGDDDDNDTINVTVADTWSMTQPGAAQNDTFTVDASAVEDDDAVVGGVANPNSTQTGGMNFDGSAETDSDLLVKGTQNDDNFVGGLQDDTFEGNGGDDIAFSGQGNDTLLGGAGKDELHGQDGADTIDGGEGDDRIWGNAGSDNLTGGAGADAFVFNATVDSDGAINSTDTITDFESGSDTIEYTLDVSGVAGGATVNLGRFAQVNDLGAGDNSLDGTAAAPVYGDGYWATNGGFVLDVDGNGDVTEGDDLQINSSNAIGAGDLDIDVNGSAGADLIRGGQGTNEMDGGAAGDADNFVLVGAIDAAQAASYQAAINNPVPGSPLIPGAVSKVLANSELTSTRGVTELNAGDTLNLVTGFDASDSVHVYGVANLALVNNGMGLNVGTINIYSDVTMTVEQLLAADSLNFAGGTDHILTVIDVDANGVVKTLSTAEIQDALSGNYANEEDFDADGNPLNVAGQTNGQTVALSTADGSPVIINGVTITVAQSEALATNEDTALPAGNVLTNELDASLVSVKSVDNVDGNVGLNVQGEYGNIVINSNGTYNYTLGGGATVANINTLAAGEVVNDQFAYTLQNAGGDESTTAFVNVTITGVNDAAVITNSATAAVGAVVEDALTLTTAGDLNHTDIDNNNADDAWVLNGGALNFGTFTSNAAGQWVYAANNASLQFLGAGITTTDSFTLTTTDGTTQVVTVTLTGVNDASTVTAASTIAGAVAEDGALTATGNVTSADVDALDADDAWAVAAGAGTNGGLGTFSVSATGQWTYNLNNTAAQALDAGQTTTDSFTLTTTDGTTQLVTVTITGQEDQSTVTAGSTVTGAVTEDAVLTATGNVTSADVDTNDANDAWNVAAAAATNAGLGSFSVSATGQWTYNLNNTAAQALDAGQTTTDSFVLTTTDGTTQVVTVTVTGAEDQSTVTAGSVFTGALTEDAGPVVVLGDVNSADVDANDADDAWVISGLTPGSAGLGTFSNNAQGQWLYALNNTAAQSLDAGATTVDTFTMTTTDGTTQLVSVTITGVEDQSSITGGVTTGNVLEDGVLTASGNVNSNDVDTGDADDAWTVVAAGAASNLGFGTFSVTTSGGWNYIADNAQLQFLDAGITTQDTFTISTTDGATQVITVTITGAEDLSTVTVASATTGAVSEDNVTTITGDLNSADVDVGDADDAWAPVVAGPSLQGLGSFTVTAAGVWNYNLNNGLATVQALDAGVTATDSFSASTTDGVAQLVTVTIAGAEDPVTLTAAPVFTAAGVAFTATDADNEALSLVNSVNGVSAVNNGVVTNLVIQQQAASASSTDLVVTDGESAPLDLGVTLLQSSGNAEVLDGSGIGESVAAYGFGGNDTLIGGAFADTLFGGAGGDSLTGGAGADTFGFLHGDSFAGGVDTILDWSAADFIDLSGVANVSGGYAEVPANTDANLAAAEAAASVAFAGDVTDIYVSEFGGNTWVFVDSNDDDGYVSGTDLAFQLTGVGVGTIDIVNFV